MSKSYSLLLTCEHASHAIPKEYRSLFTSKEVLLSHEGLDIGAYDYFKVLSQHLKCSSISAPYSRLLIELNRSEHHPKLFSRFTKSLSKVQKQTIIQEYYKPYRAEVISEVKKLLRLNKPVLHLSCHSFTPSLNGMERQADIAFLYDPSREPEKTFCAQVKRHLAYSPYRVRMNYPYKGTSDGLTTSLRKLFSKNYLGIELELNQAQLMQAQSKQTITHTLLKALKSIIEA